MEFSQISPGTETLQRLHSMIRYSGWIYDLIKPFVRGKVLEVGCGLGAMTRHLVKDGIELVSIDLDEWHVTEMKKTFRNQPNLSLYKMDFLSNNGDVLESSSFDTILLINVLEHMKKEADTIEKIHELLKTGGNFILFVPAYQWLYGTLDEIVGHVKRYEKTYLAELLVQHHLCLGQEF